VAVDAPMHAGVGQNIVIDPSFEADVFGPRINVPSTGLFGGIGAGRWYPYANAGANAFASVYDPAGSISGYRYGRITGRPAADARFGFYQNVTQGVVDAGGPGIFELSGWMRAAGPAPSMPDYLLLAVPTGEMAHGGYDAYWLPGIAPWMWFTRAGASAMGRLGAYTQIPANNPGAMNQWNLLQNRIVLDFNPDAGEEAIVVIATSDGSSVWTRPTSITEIHADNIFLGRVEAVATPVVTRDQATGYVTITSATPFARIYYSVNGAAPAATISMTPVVAGGTAYTIPFQVTADCEVRAIAVLDGWNNSAVATWVNDVTVPVFTWDIFNNGPGGTQYPQPNWSLQEAGLIRMRPQLDGADAFVCYGAAGTIIALDQDGECAMQFVHVSRLWSDADGWLDYFMGIDVNKNGNWQHINLEITVYGQTFYALLVNANFGIAADYYTVTFVVEAGAAGVYAAATTATVAIPAGQTIPANVIPGTTARTGFYFAGWYPSDPAGVVVNGDMEFTARFNPLFHYVTFEAGAGGELDATSFGLVVRIRDGFTFWPDRVPTPVANDGYEFVEWTPYNPASFVVRGCMTFTALFEPVGVVTPQIVSVTPNPAVVERDGTVDITVTTQGMPDGAWIELNVAWRVGLSIVDGPRFYIENNQAVITVAANANARYGQDGFAVSARVADAWGASVIVCSYTFVIEVQ